MSPKLIRDVVGLFWNQKVIASEIYSIILDLHNNYSTAPCSSQRRVKKLIGISLTVCSY